MNKSQKLEHAKMIQEKLEKASVTFFADYRGLKASEADDLRAALRIEDVHVSVIKNNVVRKATESVDLSPEAKDVIQRLSGPNLVAFSMGDPAAAAKAIFKFSKDHEALELKDGLMGTKKLPVNEIKQLANLPSREVMLGVLLSAFNAPARSFVSVLAAVPRSFVQVLAAVRDKKEG